MIFPGKRIGVLIVALATFGPAAAADAFPTRPIRIVVASSPGGLNDVLARIVAQKMAVTLGQPVIVENRAGGDTLVGTRYVKSAPADGYTLLAIGNTLVTQPAIKLGAGYEVKDFIGVGPIARTPQVLVVGPNSPDKTLAGIIARAKDKPDTVTFASGGVGTTGHMAGSILAMQTGTKLMHVPYKGAASAGQDVMSGLVSMMFEAVGSSAPRVRSGQVKAIGVSSSQRVAAFPDIPTIAEQGFPNFSYYVYLGLMAPAGTPKDVVDRLAAALKSALNHDDVRARFRKDGLEPMTASPEEFTDYLRRDGAEMQKLVSELGLQKQ